MSNASSSLQLEESAMLRAAHSDQNEDEDLNEDEDPNDAEEV